MHGFVTVGGRKIGKSLGNAVDPLPYIERFGQDGLRYALLRGIPTLDDGDFSLERVHRLYNADLANDLGNGVSRLTTLCEKAGFGSYDAPDVPEAPEGYHEALAKYALDQALDSLWAPVARLNAEIERAAPWKLLKEGDRTALHALLARWLGEVHAVGYWLAPFLPQGSRKVLNALLQKPIRASGAIWPRLK